MSGHNEQMISAIGGVIQTCDCSGDDPYTAAKHVLDAVAHMVKSRCTPSSDAYQNGGDKLVHAVADWIGDSGAVAR